MTKAISIFFIVSFFLFSLSVSFGDSLTVASPVLQERDLGWEIDSIWYRRHLYAGNNVTMVLVSIKFPVTVGLDHSDFTTHIYITEHDPIWLTTSDFDPYGRSMMRAGADFSWPTEGINCSIGYLCWYHFISWNPPREFFPDGVDNHFFYINITSYAPKYHGWETIGYDGNLWIAMHWGRNPAQTMIVYRERPYDHVKARIYGFLLGSILTGLLALFLYTRERIS